MYIHDAPQGAPDWLPVVARGNFWRITEGRMPPHTATRQDRDVDSDDALIRWQRLGRLIREQRLGMRLTQRELGDRAGVSIQTVNRAEMGKALTRSATSWPKLEVALEWPQGFIARYVSGDADETALAGRFRRDPVPEGDLTGMIHDVVLAVLGAAAPDTTLAELRESERIALEVAKKHGYVPALRQPQTTGDETGKDAPDN